MTEEPIETATPAAQTATVKGKVWPLVPADQLHTPLPPFVFDGTVDPVQLAYDLVESMLAHRGMGISANQIGLPYRVFAMYTTPEMSVVFNPKIVDTSSEQVVLDEGCLSYPGLIVKIRRPKSIRVRYQMANGEFTTHKYTGMTARVFQHEHDHMEGINFLMRASSYHRDKALRKMRLANRRKYG